MADHAGVRLAVPGLYNAADHDAHHAFFSCNYGFPFPWLDQLLGTYRAPAPPG
jgi:sterol desaturase/sphingolipid hydroxylase (fatty acid hydroxylase superfamily)